LPTRMLLNMRKPSPSKNPRTARKPKPKPKRKRAPIEARDPDAPHWLPGGQQWKQIPKELRSAVVKILTPAYHRFVVDAPGELERSVGLTLVHLTWLELCGQLQMASAVSDPTSAAAILQDPDDLIDRHLRLVTTKCQTSELLMKLRIMSEMFPRHPAVASLPAPANLTLPMLDDLQTIQTNHASTEAQPPDGV
jgi:hypothetical protein